MSQLNPCYFGKQCEIEKCANPIFLLSYFGFTQHTQWSKTERYSSSFFSYTIYLKRVFLFKAVPKNGICFLSHSCFFSKVTHIIIKKSMEKGFGNIFFRIKNPPSVLLKNICSFFSQKKVFFDGTIYHLSRKNKLQFERKNWLKIIFNSIYFSAEGGLGRTVVFFSSAGRGVLKKKEGLFLQQCFLPSY